MGMVWFVLYTYSINQFFYTLLQGEACKLKFYYVLINIEFSENAIF